MCLLKLSEAEEVAAHDPVDGIRNLADQGKRFREGFSSTF